MEDALEARSCVHTIGEFRRLGQSILENLVEAVRARGNEAEIRRLLSDQLESTKMKHPRRRGGGKENKLTLGISTFDWYSAWNCVPFRMVSGTEV